METTLPKGIAKKLATLEDKMQMLIFARQQLKWSISELQRENAELRSTTALLKEELKETKKKYSSLQKDFNKSQNFAKIVTNKLTPTGGLSELKESVERYIQEIDKCIEMLEETL
ncbi:hypothetical protein GCM10027275_19560 [Rhabdobacter roseus]|uniref:Chromosome segregation ATPase n=1 Tax=Rhabdobacter roseus TaxID=1655419 RepID=A0A840TQR8_9BACT|nr:hypothetical protein [Rhabdobacter roseus]MBB5283882.1 chromosome segregation ATPase [Rhabdobacter roseus]